MSTIQAILILAIGAAGCYIAMRVISKKKEG